MNESAKAIDRRPIATRNRKWAQSATTWLAARNVPPNAISIAGMCACIAAGLALGLTSVESIIVSIVGQLGDLMLAAIKRDLGLKDTGKLIPGHGGLLDRFDSLILVALAVFHYLGYFVGFGAGQPQRIFF